MPKLNYALYSKVDFAFFMEDSGGLGTITLNGVDVTPKNADGNRNRLFSIITDGTGTYAVLREVNSADADIARIELPASVINGSEGLTFDCNLTGYVRIFISEFHVTKRALDYKAEMASILAQLPDNANDLTGNSDEIALANAYSEVELYMTEYEAANYDRPAVIVAAKDVALCQAVIDAAAGSNAQLEAIEAYRQFANSLSSEYKASEGHQMRVAAGDRRVHLHRKLEVAGVFHHIEGFLETAFETAEGVVNFRRRAVETDSDRGDARFLRFLERVERRERRRARGESRADTEVGRAADQVEEVGALERVAAGEADRRFAREAGDVLDQRERLFGRKFVRSRRLLRRRAAVFANEIASAGYFVIKHQRVPTEIGDVVRFAAHRRRLSF